MDEGVETGDAAAFDVGDEDVEEALDGLEAEGFDVGRVDGRLEEAVETAVESADAAADGVGDEDVEEAVGETLEGGVELRTADDEGLEEGGANRGAG